MIEIKDKLLNNMTFIDLFAGIGGFHLALDSLGAKCVYASEWDNHAQEVYKENFGIMPDGDITKIDEKTIPNHDILCAGFPCQAFSISGKQRGFEDSRGTLFFDIARIIKHKKPKVVFLENVRNFAAHNNGQTLEVIKNTMKELGYSFHERVLNASHYGIPQKRERIYMVCFREDLNILPFSFPKAFKLTKCVEDFLIDDTELIEPLYSTREDIIIHKSIPNACYPKPIRVGSVGNGGQGERIYCTKGIAITLSAYGGGAFAKTGGYLMPNGKVRRLHPRECARIMGFPDSFKISSSPNQAYKQFGNSVVVDVIQLILQQIARSLKK